MIITLKRRILDEFYWLLNKKLPAVSTIYQILNGLKSEFYFDRYPILFEFQFKIDCGKKPLHDLDIMNQDLDKVVAFDQILPINSLGLYIAPEPSRAPNG